MAGQSGHAATGYGLAVALCLCAGTLPAGIAQAAGVERGDLLRIEVLEDPQLGRESRVDADGRIVLPKLGAISVAGQELDAVRGLIADALVRLDLIRTPTVVVEVAAWRPVFVGGAVATPGAVPFDPGLTVRQALILAGGLDRTRDGGLQTAADVDAARSELRQHLYETVQIESLVRRLEAELEPATAAGATDAAATRPEGEAAQAAITPPAPQPALAASPTAAAPTEEIVSVDDRLLDDRIAERAAQRVHLREAVALVDIEIDVLRKQAGLMQNESDLQQSELRSSRELASRSIISRTRLQEIERDASRLSRDLLDTQAFLARAQQARSDREHDLATADKEWRISLNGELRDALLERRRLATQVEILRTRLVAAGLSIGADGALIAPVARVTIYRTEDGGSQTLPAPLDTVIRAGDVLEVALVPPENG